ncbi:IS200/IS605 family transposase [Candidatus Magnetominusculus dajiuhuensis]|uniref:IS200/IS605 family transposase n=1 Tax=Candidatus Magnetominusculus dajiuhuensis TaxID=3137712 RepID=UPI003B43D2CA
MPKDIQLKANNNIVYSCKYHVVWCPKYRRKVLVNEVADRLKQLVEQKALDVRAEIIEMEVMPDHVHLLVDIDPQFGIHKLIKLINLEKAVEL